MHNKLEHLSYLVSSISACKPYQSVTVAVKHFSVVMIMHENAMLLLNYVVNILHQHNETMILNVWRYS